MHLALRMYGVLCRMPLLRARITLGEFLFQAVGQPGDTATLRVGPLRLELDMSNPQQRMMYFGAYEPGETRFVRRCLAPGDSAIDVGANVGYYSALMAAVVGRRGRVLSIEADPVNYPALATLADQSGGIIHPFWAAAVKSVSGDHPSTDFFPHPQNSSWSSSIRQAADDKAIPLEVPALTVSQILTEREHLRVALVKIDVEGAEVQVLGGLEEAFRLGARPVLLVEVVAWLFREERPSILLAGLLPRGYSSFTVKTSGRLVRTELAALDEGRTINVVLVPDERLTFLLGAGSRLNPVSPR